jgi:competence transcription factor ComK
MTDVLDKKLSLSDNQKAQIYQINRERAQLMGSFKKGDNQTADRSEMRSKFEESDNRIMAVLNQSQKAGYNQLKAERQARMQNHQGGRKKESRNKKA